MKTSVAVSNLHENSALFDDWIYVGKHACRLDEQTESFLVIFHGALTLEQFDAINALVRPALCEKRARFFILDVAELPAVPPEVRRRMGVSADPVVPQATIIVGAGSAIRILANLVRRGLLLLGRQKDTSFLFCRNLAEAHAWTERGRAGRLSRT